MLKIKNESSLNYQSIGFIIDDIIKNGEGSTNYVGKWSYYKYTLNGKQYKIETLQMKKDFKVYIGDINNEI